MKNKPKKGELLIADPSILDDVSFKRSIVLLTEYSEENSIGFIINRPTMYSINDFLPEIDCDFKVYEGGPVEQDNLYFIHRIPNLLQDSSALSNGLFWGGNFDQLQVLLNSKSIDASDIRFFLGYSGWASNQLDEEVKMKSWCLAKNNYENILTVDDKKLWKEELVKLGDKFKIWANAPDNFLLN